MKTAMKELAGRGVLESRAQDFAMRWALECVTAALFRAPISATSTRARKLSFLRPLTRLLCIFSTFCVQNRSCKNVIPVSKLHTS